MHRRSWFTTFAPHHMKQQKSSFQKKHTKFVLVIAVFLCILLIAALVYRWMHTHPASLSKQSEKESKTVELIFEETSGNHTAASITVYPGILPTGKALASQRSRVLLPAAAEKQPFTYRIKAPGYYEQVRTEQLTAADLDSGRRVISFTLTSRAGTGYEAFRVRSWTDAVESKLFSTQDLTAVNLDVLDTPAFVQSKAPHQFTTVSEGTAYLQSLTGRQAHLFFLKKEPDCPVMLFTQTDLTGITSLSQALEKLAENGKMNVLYQAQIHGNEPASGEAALTVCKRLSQDTSLLSAMNVVVIPYVNIDGSRDFTRNDSSDINLNRDALRLASPVIQDIHRLYQKLMPEIFIDSHEFQWAPKTYIPEDRPVLPHLDDIQVTCQENLNRDPSLFPIERDIVSQTVNMLSQKGFRSFFYDSSWDSTTACSYARLQNSLSFLLESQGISLGKQHFDRRVLSHYEGVFSILQQAAEQSEEICFRVSEARARMIRSGKVYDPTHRFTLTHSPLRKDGMEAVRPSFDLEGNPADSSKKTATFYNRAESRKSRSRPTAYLIAKSAPGAETAKEILQANGAEYFELAPSVPVRLGQYTGTADDALLWKPRTITFSKGAYVFPMDQTAANLIAASLEPDAGDTAANKGTFVQEGILQKRNGNYPIYRYTGRDPRSSLQISNQNPPAMP